MAWRDLTLANVVKYAGKDSIILIHKPGGKTVSGTMDTIFGPDELSIKNGQWSHTVMLGRPGFKFEIIKKPAGINGGYVSEKQLPL